MFHFPFSLVSFALLLSLLLLHRLHIAIEHIREYSFAQASGAEGADE